MQHIAEFERHSGRVPTIRELARVMGLRTSALRDLVGKLMAEEKSDGTSAFGASLRDILLGCPGPQRSLHSRGGRIADREVFLIDEDGTKLGVILTDEALQIARERGLDLFLVQPNAIPPVARLIDYGRHKFELEKREREVKRKQSVSELKEIRMRYEIDDHDYQVKLRSARAFLKNGDRIKLTVALRGREIQHADLALALLNRFGEELGDLATWNDEPKLDGKTAVMVLSPSR
jgi:translation initiation factor IF-3